MLRNIVSFKIFSIKRISLHIIPLILFVVLPYNNLAALSAMAHSSKLRAELVPELRYLETLVRNFGHIELSNEEKDLLFGKYYPEYDKNFRNEIEFNSYIKDKQERAEYSFRKVYDEAKTLFNRATVLHSQQKYFQSKQLYLASKWKIISLWKGLLYANIKRAEDILEKATYLSIDKLIQYGRENGRVKLFFIAYDPLNDILLYNPKDFKYIMVKKQIYDYIDEGYKALYHAKKEFGYVFDIRYQDNKGQFHSKRQNDDDKIIYDEKIHYFEHSFERNWTGILFKLRQAKTNGFEIFRILNSFRYNEILNKYSVGYKKVDSFFDDRIPDQYQIDFIDAMNRIHQEEIKLFEQHLTSRGIDPKKYIVSENSLAIKKSGFQDDFSAIDKKMQDSEKKTGHLPTDKEDKNKKTTTEPGKTQP